MIFVITKEKWLLVWQKHDWTRKFYVHFLKLILVAQGLLFQSLPGALGAPLSVLSYGPVKGPIYFYLAFVLRKNGGYR